MSKGFIRVLNGDAAGEYWKAEGQGTTKNIALAHAYDRAQFDAWSMGDGYVEFVPEPLLDDGSNKTRTDLRPRNSAERKGEPIHSGVMCYFPDALAAVARVSKAGNDKHNPGEKLHWARGKSTDQLDAAARHLLTPEAVDPESRELELAHEAWRSLAELQLAEERRLAAAGIMPYSGIIPKSETVVKVTVSAPADCTCPGPGKIKMNCPRHGITLDGKD